MEAQNQHTKDQKKSNGPDYEVKLGTTLLENWVEEVKSLGAIIDIVDGPH